MNKLLGVELFTVRAITAAGADPCVQGILTMGARGSHKPNPVCSPNLAIPIG